MKIRKILSDIGVVFGSMRFAIALLSLLAIASVIGTILKQNEPIANYIQQFGVFWSAIFERLSLYYVYSSWWFLLILFILVISLTLCLRKHIPKIFLELRNWKYQIQIADLQFLQSLKQKTIFFSKVKPANLSVKLIALLQKYPGENYSCKMKNLNLSELTVGGLEKSQSPKNSLLIVARSGAARKFGYIFAHSAIVIICIGAFVDSNILLRAQLFFEHKKLLPNSQSETLVLSEIADINRLPTSNSNFLAHLFLPEGQESKAAIVSMTDGMLLQDLPFVLRLKKFKIDYYSTGMPKLFASNVELTDVTTGAKTLATITVNHPLVYKNIAIYQSSFADGGSKLQFTGYYLHKEKDKSGEAKRTQSFKINGIVGQNIELKNLESNNASIGAYTLELTGFRAANIENINENFSNNIDSQKKATGIAKYLYLSLLGSGAKKANSKILRNIGPSVQYRLRDAAGKAYEFNNYMLPVQIDGTRVFLFGIRNFSNEDYRYLHIPEGANGGIDAWLAFRAALQDPYMRKMAAKNYATTYKNEIANNKNNDYYSAQNRSTQLAESVTFLLKIFAGNQSSGNDKAGGFAQIATLIDKTVPEQNKANTAKIFVQMVHGGLYELWLLAQQKFNLQNGLNTKSQSISGHENEAAEKTFFLKAVQALSDSAFYPAPVMLHLDNFTEVLASVFQLSKSPGKYIVYIGCTLLLLGIFAMFYINETKIWILIKECDSGDKNQSEILLAGSINRASLDFAKNFALLSNYLQKD